VELDWATVWLSFAVLGTGAAAIVASYHSKGRLAFVALKPLTTLLILIMVLASAAGPRDTYTVLIVAGLLFSWVGDIVLMLPARCFTYGILSFSVTHVLYLSAFTLLSGVALVHLLTPLFGLVAAALAALVWRGVSPSFRIPVVLYVALITVMLAQAAGAALGQAASATTLAATGAALFFVSDAALAIDRFRSRFVAAKAIVLSTYWLGQWLIALSARLDAPPM